jgi:U3 small nucleolar RNA-associated protein 13
VENDIEKGRSGLETLQRHVQNWPMDRTTQVIRYCRDWNTRARNSHIAMLVIKAIVTTIPAQKLASSEGVPELLAGITPYAERHFTRLDNLHASSYLLDFTLFSMGNMDIDEITPSKAFADWETNAQLVLPPKQGDGRIQVGGAIGLHRKAAQLQEGESDEVVTIGSSDTSDDESEMDEGESQNIDKVSAKNKSSVEEESNESASDSGSDDDSSS